MSMPKRLFVLLHLLLVLPGLPAAASAATQAPIIGQITAITIADPSNQWSGGTITVGGKNVIIPRNLLIDLPANRLTLKQLFDDAPPECALNGETGLASNDLCTCGKGAYATILANRTDAGDIIAGEVSIAKGTDTITGVVTYIDHTNGYFRVNGKLGDPTRGAMLRINDPDGVHTIQRGPGCRPGSLTNCSADVRFTNDPENYTNTFATGYPLCIPSTQTLPPGRPTAGAADGTNDPFCPHTNRAANPVADSSRFAPLQLGDHLTAEGNYETVAGVYFFSAHTMNVHAALTTAPGQPDYMIFDEVEWDIAGFQNERVRMLMIGFTTLGDSELDVFALHHAKNNVEQRFPIASTFNNPDTVRQGIPPNDAGIFKIRYDVDFAAGVKAGLSPCENLSNAGLPGCPGGNTTDIAQNFSILSPVAREIIAVTRNKRDNAIGPSHDIKGADAPNGQYLTPVGMGHPEFVEIDLARIQTPLIFEGEPWLLDRRVGPGGCEGACEATTQALDPFPFSGLDPRTQAAVPVAARDRIFAVSPFGPTDRVDYPPANPPEQPFEPVPASVNACVSSTPSNLGPVAAADTGVVPAGGSVTIRVLSNDSDGDGIDLASIAIAASPSNGTAVATAGGTIIYTPKPGFGGIDKFTYTVEDSLGAVSNVAEVTITVLPPGGNTPPLAGNDAANAVTAIPTVINVVANDTDPNGLNLTSLALTAPPAHGTAIANANGTVSYTSSLGFTGVDTFKYRIADNLGALSNEATVTVNVQATVPVNETLVIDRAEFRIFTNEWRIDGTSTQIAGNTITIYNNSTATGTPLGTAVVDATGAWRLRTTTLPAPTRNVVSIRSTFGIKVENFPLVLRN